MHFLLPAKWQSVAHPHRHTGTFVVQACPPTHTPLPPHHHCFSIPSLSSSYLTWLLSARCEWDTVWAAPWHYEARGADRTVSTVGKARGGSQWRGEAKPRGSFLWKWINVTLPRVRVHTGTAGGRSKKGTLGMLSFLRTRFSYISTEPEVSLVKAEVIGYGPADHPGVQVFSISIRQRI